MPDRNPEDMVFETVASCTLAIAALAITALLYQLITFVVPLLETTVFPTPIDGVPQNAVLGRRGAKGV